MQRFPHGAKTCLRARDHAMPFRPSIPSREFAEVGGLMTTGPTSPVRLTHILAGILKGAKPLRSCGDLRDRIGKLTWPSGHFAVVKSLRSLQPTRTICNASGTPAQGVGGGSEETSAVWAQGSPPLAMDRLRRGPPLPARPKLWLLRDRLTLSAARISHPLAGRTRSPAQSFAGAQKKRSRSGLFVLWAKGSTPSQAAQKLDMPFKSSWYERQCARGYGGRFLQGRRPTCERMN
jgi:hypothetical protein